MQLSMFGEEVPVKDGEHLTLAALARIELKPAVFYYCFRELAAGRELPVKVTEEQEQYIKSWM